MSPRPSSGEPPKSSAWQTSTTAGPPCSKERSPSCGSGQIYDGTFTKTLTLGDGLTAQMLKKHGITVYGESQIEELIGSRPFFFSI